MKIANETDFNNADEKLNLKKISADEVNITDVHSIWDGPLNGFCERNGQKFYFHCFDQLDDSNEEDRWPRKYLLINLTQEQYESIDQKSPPLIIGKDQVIGWFDASFNAQGKAYKFMESYFIWKNQSEQKQKNELSKNQEAGT